jgi:predicted oxidoreductase (fatty acid repression mutant protein)
LEGSSSDENEENSSDCGSDDGKSDSDEEAESEESVQSDEENEGPWDVIMEAVKEACSPDADDDEECFLDEFETLYGIVETFLKDDVYRAVKDTMEVFQESHILMSRNEALSASVEFRKAKILKYLEEDEPTTEPAAFVNPVGATSEVKEDEEGEAKDYDHWDFINQKAKDVLEEAEDASLEKSFLDEFQRFFTLAEAFKGDAVVRGVKRTKHKLMMEDETLDHKEGLDLAIEIRRRKILENFEDDEEDASMDSE